jgi:hypothetical protein
MVTEDMWSAVCMYRVGKGVRIAMIDIKVTKICFMQPCFSHIHALAHKLLFM